jgi:hypothetical protein
MISKTKAKKRLRYVPAKVVYEAIDGEGLLIKWLLASMGIPITERCPGCGELLNDVGTFRADWPKVRWRCAKDGFRSTFQSDES